MSTESDQITTDEQHTTISQPDASGDGVDVEETRLTFESESSRDLNEHRFAITELISERHGRLDGETTYAEDIHDKLVAARNEAEKRRAQIEAYGHVSVELTAFEVVVLIRAHSFVDEQGIADGHDDYAAELCTTLKREVPDLGVELALLDVDELED